MTSVTRVWLIVPNGGSTTADVPGSTDYEMAEPDQTPAGLGAAEMPAAVAGPLWFIVDGLGTVRVPAGVYDKVVADTGPSLLYYDEDEDEVVVGSERELRDRLGELRGPALFSLAGEGPDWLAPYLATEREADKADKADKADRPESAAMPVEDEPAAEGGAVGAEETAAAAESALDPIVPDAEATTQPAGPAGPAEALGAAAGSPEPAAEPAEPAVLAADGPRPVAAVPAPTGQPAATAETASTATAGSDSDTAASDETVTDFETVTAPTDVRAGSPGPTDLGIADIGHTDVPPTAEPTSLIDAFEMILGAVRAPSSTAESLSFFGDSEAEVSDAGDDASTTTGYVSSAADDAGGTWTGRMASNLRHTIGQLQSLAEMPPDASAELQTLFSQFQIGQDGHRPVVTRDSLERALLTVQGFAVQLGRAVGTASNDAQLRALQTSLRDLGALMSRPGRRGSTASAASDASFLTQVDPDAAGRLATGARPPPLPSKVPIAAGEAYDASARFAAPEPLHHGFRRAMSMQDRFYRPAPAVPGPERPPRPPRDPSTGEYVRPSRPPLARAQTAATAPGTLHARFEAEREHLRAQADDMARSVSSADSDGTVRPPEYDEDAETVVPLYEDVAALDDWASSAAPRAAAAPAVALAVDERTLNPFAEPAPSPAPLPTPPSGPSNPWDVPPPTPPSLSRELSQTGFRAEEAAQFAPFVPPERHHHLHRGRVEAVAEAGGHPLAVAGPPAARFGPPSPSSILRAETGYFEEAAEPRRRSLPHGPTFVEPSSRRARVDRHTDSLYSLQRQRLRAAGVKMDIEMKTLGTDAQERAEVGTMGMGVAANEAEKTCALSLIELEFFSADNMALAIYYAQQAHGDVSEAIDLIENDLKDVEAFENGR
ncbi:uncharacterized protein V1510DRAFT_286285 [Dipodascopsis tothii]|uniref:uncharacterized protein n=1 Tax=Dipodascopsis tothii TaxID=44089 RepID=UPI0034CEF286